MGGPAIVYGARSQVARMKKWSRSVRGWELREQGMTCREIAARLEEEGFGRWKEATIMEMFHREEKRAQERLVDYKVKEKQRQLEELRKVEEEAWEAWGKSKTDEVVVRKKRSRGARPGQLQQAGGGPEGFREVTRQVKGQCGDPRYLAEVRAALEGQRKILGLDAAERHEHEHRGVSEAFESVQRKLDALLEPGEN